MYQEFTLAKDDIFYLSSTSKGNQTKWYADGKFIKADTMGYESIAEAVVSDFLGYTDIMNYVDYGLCKIDYEGKSYFGCYSNNFLMSDEVCVSFYSLLKKYFGSENRLNSQAKRFSGVNWFNTVKTIIEDMTGLDLTLYLSQILTLDALILNEDRHLNNLCVIRGSDYWRVCPIFDNGLSLLSDIDDYPMSVNARGLMYRVKSKPFSTDFYKQFKYAGSVPIKVNFGRYREDLENKWVEFKDKEFQRAKFVLLSRCKQTEGKLWVNVQ